MGIDDSINIVIGASHNRYEQPQQEVDEEIREKAAWYRARRLMPSYKFKRIKNSCLQDSQGLPIDENKFIMSLRRHRRHLTSLDFLLILLALEQDTRICTVGGPKVDLHVQRANRFLGENYAKDGILFGDEGENPKLGTNIKTGKTRLGNPRKFCFISGDIPHLHIPTLFHQYHSFDPEKHDLWLDFNAKTRVFLGKPFFDRNYYQKFSLNPFLYYSLSNRDHSLLDRNKAHPYKEPNAYFFGYQFQEWDVANAIYGNHERGGPRIGLLLDIFKARKWTRHDFKLPVTSSLLLRDLFYVALHYLAFGDVHSTLGTFERAAKTVTGRRVKATIDHKDPFRLKDIDAYHDLVYYMMLHEEIDRRGGLKTVYSERTAQALEDFDTFLGEQPEQTKQELYLTYNTPDYLLLRARMLGIEEYIDENNNLQLQPRPDEDIDAAVTYLQKRKNFKKVLIESA